MEKFDTLLQEIDTVSNGLQRDRGTRFEMLVAAYLRSEPAYKKLYDQVWMLKDVPESYGIPHKDLGVDLVARNRATGTLTAVQAKYYQGKVGKDTINSFVADLNKRYYHDGLLVSTTDNWNQNAEAALEDGSKSIVRIGLSDLRHAHFDWSEFSFNHEEPPIKASHKKPRNYQQKAIIKATAYFKTHDRGKLIMAPGTGKTFTSLKIAEAMQQASGQDDYYVLYLVPSIQLLSQTLFSWNSDADEAQDLVSFAVTSDRNASKKRFDNDDTEDMDIQDIGFPATTDADKLMANYRQLPPAQTKRMTVVFSTYQSIAVLHDAQSDGFPEFDLIIADEAHRTVGAHEANKESSPFMQVHSNRFVRAKHRLYQTATPKIYSEDTKKRAKEDSVVVASMDDPALFGDEVYRLGFGEAVSRGILTDYKVEVLAVDESMIQTDMQNAVANENGLQMDDIGKIIGVWNAMMKRGSFSKKTFGPPMRRAIAFSAVIDNQRGHGAGKVGSKQMAHEFSNVVNEYLGGKNNDQLQVQVKHVDGTMNALQKKDAIDWLAGDFPDDQARILSNVKFLTEGIDVPNLDAIIFFAPKKSQIDIVQAVGRIMRRTKDKEYGYVILPVVVPADVTPESVLDDNKTYKAIWQVLNALRSIDERFDATVNKLDLNKQRPANINVIGVGSAGDNDTRDQDGSVSHGAEQTSLNLNWHKVKDAIYGRIVRKVGDRRYLEDWSGDVEQLATRHIQWINNLLKDPDSAFTRSFAAFLKSLQYNINSEIDQDQAVEMLAQHIITKPIFEALFDQYSFVNDNPVSRAMEDMTQRMVAAGFEQEQAKLKPFYDSVRLRATGIDNAAGKQQFIVTLYNNFFKTSFRQTTERLGIVFTPVEIVDFIVKSVDEALKEHFGRGIASEGVHVLDPFTGTGTFITRTLDYLADEMKQGKITLSDITRKYTQELHANEIILLSYYIAAVNIEATFDEINGPEKYVPFKGIVLTDTFASTEGAPTLDDDLFNGNNERLKEQQAVPITAIISNPPYSVGQRSQNDNAQNVHYPKLEKQIASTYAKWSNAANLTGLYDSYIKAFRWASDRLGERGVIGFVTNAGYLDSGSADGLRKALYQEFNYLYIFNLRGNARTQGEQRRKERDNVFGQGTRTPIAISVLVRDGSQEHHLYYKDIGDYLSREQKLSLLGNDGSINGVKWHQIIPDNNNDWLNQRDPNYQLYIPLGGKRDQHRVFIHSATGLQTNRDAWVYGYSKEQVIKNSQKLIAHYNDEVQKANGQKWTDYPANSDTAYINWSRGLKRKLTIGERLTYQPEDLVLGMYRPFTKKWLYYNDALVEMPGMYKKRFGSSNKVIYTTGRGASRDFSALATDLIPDIQLLMNGQGFMCYNNEVGQQSLLPTNRYNVSAEFAEKLELSTNDTFYYVYGVLNSPEYQAKYANDLKKDLARIPVVKGIQDYVAIGKQLMDLHINYEHALAYSGVDVTYNSDHPSYKVKKMRFGTGKDRSTIKFNSDITIKGVPERAYDYVVNGRSAIEWIMDQYQVKTDKQSQITDDPNDFSEDPKYIFSLLLRIITVSLKTLDLVDQLPKFELAEKQ